MNVVIDGVTCPVVTRAVEPVVLHPHYHVLRVLEVEPDVGLYVLAPLTARGRALFALDHGAGVVVTWIGDVMDALDLDLRIAVEIDAAHL